MASMYLKTWTPYITKENAFIKTDLQDIPESTMAVQKTSVSSMGTPTLLIHT